MKTTKAPTTAASKSTKLTDAPKPKVSPSKPEVDMRSDDTTNANLAVNSDNAVNSATPSNPDNLFDNEQMQTETTAVTATTEQPKQQRIGKQQRKSDFAGFKTTYLMPSKLMKRHPVNIEDSVWEKLERIARILGDRDTTVGSYINAILIEHLDMYGDDIEIWRKL